MKASLLTIGTEVVDGEIVNTNAAWLASELSGLGFQLTHHLSTADDPSEMLEALAWLEKKSDWIFVTGGLGPTTDDKTREIVSKFLGRELVYDESVFEKLKRLHESRGLKIKEAHKHQCWFPKDSRQLDNPVGSALGFKEKSKGGAEVVVLPGPPRELKGVFDKELRSELESMELKKAELRTWTLLGITESAAAEVTEGLFEGANVELGYRASIPYVHVKVWFFEGSDVQKYVDEVEAKFGDLIVARNGDEPVAPLLEKVKGQAVLLHDAYSQGLIASRLNALTDFLSSGLEIYTGSSEFSTDAKVVLKIQSDSSGVFASLSKSGQTITEKLEVPYKLDPNGFRARKYFSELAFQFWMQSL